MMRAKRAKKPDPAKLIRKHLVEKDIGKQGYSDSDATLKAIRQLMKPGESVSIGGGQTATLVDNYADKDVVFRPCGVRRFEISVSRAS